jgi:hypothetical protein
MNIILDTISNISLRYRLYNLCNKNQALEISPRVRNRKVQMVS